MSEFEDYASYLDEDYDQEQQLQEQQELAERYCDAEPWYDDDYNDNHHNIQKECPLWTTQEE